MARKCGHTTIEAAIMAESCPDCAGYVARRFLKIGGKKKGTCPGCGADLKRCECQKSADTLELEIAIDVIMTVVKVTIDSAHDLNGCMARCLFDVLPDNGGAVVTIKSRSAAMSVIAHEAVHAAAFMLEHRGISTQHDQMELTAYVVQHICEKVEIALYS